MTHRLDRQSTHRVRRGLLLAAVVGSTVVTACSSDDSSTSPATDGSEVTVPASEGAGVTTPGSTPDIDPGLQPYIDLAVTDLAARLQRDAGDINTRSAALIIWPDASLGCPVPGMSYAAVQTDGALIVLEVDGTAYDYHAGGDTTPFLCDPKGGGPAATVGG